MKKPGVILRRPVGSEGSLREHFDLPTELGGGGKRTRTARKAESRKAKKPLSRPIDKAAERKAALAFEKEQTPPELPDKLRDRVTHAEGRKGCTYADARTLAVYEGRIPNAKLHIDRQTRRCHRVP